MASRILTVYDLVNSYTYNNMDKKPTERIEIALPYIFDFQYPCWNEEYKRILEKKIIMHYLMDEINVEVPELWKIMLEEKLNLIMPYYNSLYESIVKYDFTKNYNVTTTNTENVDIIGSVIDHGSIENTTNTTQSNNGVVIESNTPQARVNTSDGRYANKITDSDIDNIGSSTSNNTSDNTTTNTGATTKTASTTTSGSNTHISDLIMKYRDSLLNIDKMIIEELQDNFLMIYRR